MTAKFTQAQIITSLESFISESEVATVCDVPTENVMAFLEGLKVHTATRNAKANANRNAKVRKFNDAIWERAQSLLTYEPKKAIYFAEAIGTIDDEVISANRVARIFTAHKDVVEKVAIKGGCGYKLVGNDPNAVDDTDDTDKVEEVEE